MTTNARYIIYYISNKILGLCVVFLFIFGIFREKFQVIFIHFYFFVKFTVNIKNYM